MRTVAFASIASLLISSVSGAQYVTDRFSSTMFLGLKGLKPECMDVAGGSHEDGASLVYWPCHTSTDTNQQFDYNPDTRELIIRHSQKCVTLNEDGKLVQMPCNGDENQKWWFQGYGNHADIRPMSITDMCVDIPKVGGIWPVLPGMKTLVIRRCVGYHNYKYNSQRWIKKEDGFQK
jgi:hypothetical protein